MSARVVSLAEQRVVPWRNGLGTTREVVASPEGAGAADRFLWRVSAARVERSCPFSAFDGHDRTLLLLAGDGLELDFAGAAPPRRLDRPLEACAFRGEWRATCRLLGGPVDDLNIMVDRARAAAEVRVLRRASDLALGDAAVAVAVGGAARATLGAAAFALGPGDALRADALPAGAWLDVDLEPGAALVVATFTARAPAP